MRVFAGNGKLRLIKDFGMQIVEHDNSSISVNISILNTHEVEGSILGRDIRLLRKELHFLKLVVFFSQQSCMFFRLDILTAF